MRNPEIRGRSKSKSPHMKGVVTAVSMVGLWCCHNMDTNGSSPDILLILVGVFQGIYLMAAKFLECFRSGKRGERRSTGTIISFVLYSGMMMACALVVSRMMVRTQELRLHCIGVLGIPLLIDTAWRVVEQRREKRRMLFYFMVAVYGAESIVLSYLLGSDIPMNIFFCLLPMVLVLGWDEFMIRHVIPDSNILTSSSRVARCVAGFVLIALSIYGVVHPGTIGLVFKTKEMKDAKDAIDADLKILSSGFDDVSGELEATKEKLVTLGNQRPRQDLEKKRHNLNSVIIVGQDQCYKTQESIKTAKKERETANEELMKNGRRSTDFNVYYDKFNDAKTKAKDLKERLNKGLASVRSHKDELKKVEKEIQDNKVGVLVAQQDIQDLEERRRKIKEGMEAGAGFAGIYKLRQLHRIASRVLETAEYVREFPCEEVSEEQPLTNRDING